jgi:hypothetical protein
VRNYEGSLNKSIYDPPPRPATKARTLRDFRRKAWYVIQPASAASPRDSGSLREDVRSYVVEWKRLRKKRRVG